MGTNMLRAEHFVPVAGFPQYEVSNYGRVINCRRGRDLKPSPDGAGYLRVALYREGVRYEFGVHRLVAAAFFANFDEDVEVRHINEDKNECAVMNLTLGKRLKIRVRIIETGEVFDSLQACAEHLGVESYRISTVLSYKKSSRSVRGMHFEVVDQ